MLEIVTRFRLHSPVMTCFSDLESRNFNDLILISFAS
jgi:hypothetical protein